MNIVLFDQETTWKNLLPLTFTRPVSQIRVGILTIAEKWEKSMHASCSYHTQDYLRKKFPMAVEPDAVFVNSKYCPDAGLVNAIQLLRSKQAIYKNGELIAAFGALKDAAAFEKTEYAGDVFKIENLWNIFQKNAAAIEADFKLITTGRATQPLSSTVTVIGDRSLVFLEEGAMAEACILNTTGGPIYLGKDAEIMEGSLIRGPLALCEHSVIKLGTKIYGATTIGPYSKVGGEISNSVIFGYSNKGHDGFLGNSILGEWCNLGADTNNSNLKNNYGNVKLFNYLQNKQIDTGLQFCGLIMGDHSKSGINTMFNTGTVAGIASNIYGGGFPPTHIPSFSWGGSEGFETYRLEKVFETAEKVFERRGLVFDDTEKEILQAVFNGDTEGRQ